MEKQVDTIALSRFSNYAHFNYMDAVYKNLNSLLLMGEKLATELPIFEEKLDNENEVLVQSRKNDLTEEIEVGDDQRDSGLSGYAQVLKGFLYLKSGEQYEAAKKLDKHLSDFNLSPRMSLIKQTGAMKNLIEDLETTYTSQVTSLGLTPFVTMMKEGNTAVDTNLQARDARSAGKMKAAVLTARSETDEIYNKIIKKINALAIVDEENADEYGQLIDELNAQSYCLTKVRHKGSRILACNDGNNHFTVTAENVKVFTIFTAPGNSDPAKPFTVECNGRKYSCRAGKSDRRPPYTAFIRVEL